MDAVVVCKNHHFACVGDPFCIEDKLYVCVQRKNYSITTQNFLTIFNVNIVINITVLLF